MKARFENYTCPEDFINANVQSIAPMLAKEIEEEEQQDKVLKNPKYIIEEKLDGNRNTMHFFEDSVRCFSRRVSDKTNWPCEKTDLVPHIRELNVPQLAGTIIDGEMFIPHKSFEDVSSTLNCKWEKAVTRQEELGKIVFNAFDILFFKGIDIQKLPLHRRKYYLKKVIAEINSEYVKEVNYTPCDKKVSVQMLFYNTDVPEKYLNLKREMEEHDSVSKSSWYELSPRAYYEYVVATGGEGVIVKPLSGRYLQGNKGWEYSKIKKFLTKDVIVVGFAEPTDAYRGKFPTVDKWDYWETVEHDIIDLEGDSKEFRDKFVKSWGYDQIRPISKHFAKGWVGNIIFGVVITDDEISKLPKNKKFEIKTMEINMPPCNDIVLSKVLIVGECSGFEESMREYFTENQDTIIGSVIEVKANEIFKNTGRLRHPRFFRVREDKANYECTWKEHLNETTL